MLIKRYKSTFDVDALYYNHSLDEFPDSIDRNEAATGLLTRGIFVNGNYLIVSECTVQQTQNIEQIWNVWGGPRSVAADIGKKWVEGEISTPIRVDRNNVIDPAIMALIHNADKPIETLKIDTNHALSHYQLTARDPYGYGATDFNELLSFDCALVKKLTITLDKGVLKLTASIIGMIDGRQRSNLVQPPQDYRLGRVLTFADCDISRFESAMRTVISVELSITNEIDTPIFLGSILDGSSNLSPNQFIGRTDQIALLGVKQTQLSGNFEEVLRMGVEKETFIHGGLMVNENLQIDFQSFKTLIKSPLFKIGEQKLNSKLLKRRTEFFSQMNPSLTKDKGSFFLWV